MKRKTKRNTVLIALLIAVIFAISGTLTAMYFSGGFSINNRQGTTDLYNTKQLDNNGSAIDGSVVSKTSEQVLQELQQEQINVTDNISSHILFPSGTAGSKGSWTVENPSTNNVIMQCEVYLGDQLIAKTVPIYPNQHIEDVTLSADLSPGLYDVIAYINYYKTDSNEYISKVGYNIKLTVQ